MIKKPSFYDFALLHKLADERIANDAENVLITRRKDGTLELAVWNLVDMDKVAEAKPIRIRLKFTGVAADAKGVMQRVDEEHGNPLRAYASMGSPRYPTREQVAEMNRVSALPRPEEISLKDGQLELTVPVNGLALIEVRGNSK